MRSLQEQQVPPKPLSDSHELNSQKMNRIPHAALNDAR